MTIDSSHFSQPTLTNAFPFTLEEWESMEWDDATRENFLFNIESQNPEFAFAFAEQQEKPTYVEVLEAWGRSSYEEGSGGLGLGTGEEERTAENATSHPLLNPQTQVASLTSNEIARRVRKEVTKEEPAPDIPAALETSELTLQDDSRLLSQADAFLKACGMHWAIDENTWGSGLVNAFSTANLVDNEKTIIDIIDSLQTPEEAQAFVEIIPTRPLAQKHSIYELLAREFEGKQLGRVQGKLNAVLKGEVAFEKQVYGLFAEDMEVIVQSMKPEEEPREPTLEERMQVSYPDDPSLDTPVAPTKEELAAQVAQIQKSYFDIFDTLGFFKPDSSFPFTAAEIFTMPPAILVILASAFINVKSKIDYVGKLYGLAHLQGATGFFSYFTGITQLFRQNSVTAPLVGVVQKFGQNLRALVDAVKKRSGPEILQVSAYNLNNSMQRVMKEAYVFESQEMEGVRIQESTYASIAQSCAEASASVATMALLPVAGPLWAFTAGTAAYTAMKTTGDAIQGNEITLTSTALNIKGGAIESGLVVAGGGINGLVQGAGAKLVGRELAKEGTEYYASLAVTANLSGIMYKAVKEGKMVTTEEMAIYGAFSIFGGRLGKMAPNKTAEFGGSYLSEVGEEIGEAMVNKEGINAALIASSMSGALSEANTFADHNTELTPQSKPVTVFADDTAKALNVASVEHPWGEKTGARDTGTGNRELGTDSSRIPSSLAAGPESRISDPESRIPSSINLTVNVESAPTLDNMGNYWRDPNDGRVMHAGTGAGEAKNGFSVPESRSPDPGLRTPNPVSRIPSSNTPKARQEEPNAPTSQTDPTSLSDQNSLLAASNEQPANTPYASVLAPSSLAPSFNESPANNSNMALAIWQNSIARATPALRALAKANPARELAIFTNNAGQIVVGVGSENTRDDHIEVGDITAWYVLEDGALKPIVAQSLAALNPIGHAHFHNSTSTPSADDLSYAQYTGGFGTLNFDDAGNASWSFSYPVRDEHGDVEVYTEYAPNFMPFDTDVLNNEYDAAAANVAANRPPVTDIRHAAMPGGKDGSSRTGSDGGAAGKAQDTGDTGDGEGGGSAGSDAQGFMDEEDLALLFGNKPLKEALKAPSVIAALQVAILKILDRYPNLPVYIVGRSEGSLLKVMPEKKFQDFRLNNTSSFFKNDDLFVLKIVRGNDGILRIEKKFGKSADTISGIKLKSGIKLFEDNTGLKPSKPIPRAGSFNTDHITFLDVMPSAITGGDRQRGFSLQIVAGDPCRVGAAIGGVVVARTSQQWTRKGAKQHYFVAISAITGEVLGQIDSPQNQLKKGKGFSRTVYSLKQFIIPKEGNLVVPVKGGATVELPLRQSSDGRWFVDLREIPRPDNPDDDGGPDGTGGGSGGSSGGAGNAGGDSGIGSRGPGTGTASSVLHNRASNLGFSRTPNTDSHDSSSIPANHNTGYFGDVLENTELGSTIAKLSEQHPQAEFTIYYNKRNRGWVIAQGDGQTHQMGRTVAWYNNLGLSIEAPRESDLTYEGHFHPYNSNAYPSAEDMANAHWDMDGGVGVVLPGGAIQWNGTYLWHKPDGTVEARIYTGTGVYQAVIDRETGRYNEIDRQEPRTAAMAALSTKSVLDGDDQWISYQTAAIDVTLHTNRGLPKPHKDLISHTGPNEDGALLHVAAEDGTTTLVVVDAMGGEENAVAAKNVALNTTENCLDCRVKEPAEIFAAIGKAYQDPSNNVGNGDACIALAQLTTDESGRVWLNPAYHGDCRVVVILPNGKILVTRDHSWGVEYFAGRRDDFLLRNNNSSSAVIVSLAKYKGLKNYFIDWALWLLDTMNEEYQRNHVSIPQPWEITTPVELVPGSRVLVLSDGGYDFADLTHIAAIATQGGNSKAIVDDIYAAFTEANRRTKWPKNDDTVYDTPPTVDAADIAYPFVDTDGQVKYRVATRQSLLDSVDVPKHKISEEEMAARRNIKISSVTALRLKEPTTDDRYYTFLEILHLDNFTAAAVIVKNTSSEDAEGNLNPGPRAAGALNGAAEITRSRAGQDMGATATGPQTVTQGTTTYIVTQTQPGDADNTIYEVRVEGATNGPCVRVTLGTDGGELVGAVRVAADGTEIALATREGLRRIATTETFHEFAARVVEESALTSGGIILSQTGLDKIKNVFEANKDKKPKNPLALLGNAVLIFALRFHFRNESNVKDIGTLISTKKFQELVAHLKLQEKLGIDLGEQNSSFILEAVIAVVYLEHGLTAAVRLVILIYAHDIEGTVENLKETEYATANVDENFTAALGGYEFSNKKLLARALHHESLTNCSLTALGGCLISVLVAQHLYDAGEFSQGKLSTLTDRSRVLRDLRALIDTVAGYVVGLTAEKNIKDIKKLAALKNVLGAMVCDGDIDKAMEKVCGLIEPLIKKAAEGTPLTAAPLAPPPALEVVSKVQGNLAGIQAAVVRALQAIYPKLEISVIPTVVLAEDGNLTLHDERPFLEHLSDEAIATAFQPTSGVALNPADIAAIEHRLGYHFGNAGYLQAALDTSGMKEVGEIVVELFLRAIGTQGVLKRSWHFYESLAEGIGPLARANKRGDKLVTIIGAVAADGGVLAAVEVCRNLGLHGLPVSISGPFTPVVDSPAIIAVHPRGAVQILDHNVLNRAQAEVVLGLNYDDTIADYGRVNFNISNGSSLAAYHKPGTRLRVQHLRPDETLNFGSHDRVYVYADGSDLVEVTINANQHVKLEPAELAYIKGDTKNAGKLTADKSVVVVVVGRNGYDDDSDDGPDDTGGGDSGSGIRDTGTDTASSAQPPTPYSPLSALAQSAWSLFMGYVVEPLVDVARKAGVLWMLNNSFAHADDADIENNDALAFLPAPNPQPSAPGEPLVALEPYRRPQQVPEAMELGNPNDRLKPGFVAGLQENHQAFLDLIATITPFSDPTEVGEKLQKLEFKLEELLNLPEVKDAKPLPDGRIRVVLAFNDDVEAIFIIWPLGKGTEIHDHGDSVGVDLILSEGNLVERVYAVDALGTGALTLIETNPIISGKVSSIGMNLVHSVRNDQYAGNVISIHLYWRPLNKTKTYGGTDTTNLVSSPAVVQSDNFDPQSTIGPKVVASLPPLLSEVSLPDGVLNIDGVRDWSRAQGAEALFDKILANIRCIDKNAFDAALRQMERAIEQFVGDDSYYLVVSSKGQSSRFVAQRLSLRRAPLRIITAEDTVFRLEQLSTDSKIKFVVVDDAAYSGGQIRSLIEVIRESNDQRGTNKAPYAHSRVMVATVAITRTAAALLQGLGCTIGFSYEVPLLSNILTAAERQRLLTLTQQQLGFKAVAHPVDLTGDATHDNAVLTFLYCFGAPDNFPSLLNSRNEQMGVVLSPNTPRLPILIDNDVLRKPMFLSPGSQTIKESSYRVRRQLLPCDGKQPLQVVLIESLIESYSTQSPKYVLIDLGEGRYRLVCADQRFFLHRDLLRDFGNGVGLVAAGYMVVSEEGDVVVVDGGSTDYPTTIDDIKVGDTKELAAESNRGLQALANILSYYYKKIYTGDFRGKDADGVFTLRLRDWYASGLNASFLQDNIANGYLKLLPKTPPDGSKLSFQPPTEIVNWGPCTPVSLEARTPEYIRECLNATIGRSDTLDANRSEISELETPVNYAVVDGEGMFFDDTTNTVEVGRNHPYWNHPDMLAAAVGGHEVTHAAENVDLLDMIGDREPGTGAREEESGFSVPESRVPDPGSHTPNPESRTPSSPPSPREYAEVHAIARWLMICDELGLVVKYEDISSKGFKERWKSRETGDALRQELHEAYRNAPERLTEEIRPRRLGMQGDGTLDAAREGRSFVDVSVQGTEFDDKNIDDSAAQFHALRVLGNYQEAELISLMQARLAAARGRRAELLAAHEAASGMPSGTLTGQTEFMRRGKEKLFLLHELFPRMQGPIEALMVGAGVEDLTPVSWLNCRTTTEPLMLAAMGDLQVTVLDENRGPLDYLNSKPAKVYCKAFHLLDAEQLRLLGVKTGHESLEEYVASKRSVPKILRVIMPRYGVQQDVALYKGFPILALSGLDQLWARIKHTIHGDVVTAQWRQKFDYIDFHVYNWIDADVDVSTSHYGFLTLVRLVDSLNPGGCIGMEKYKCSFGSYPHSPTPALMKALGLEAVWINDGSIIFRKVGPSNDFVSTLSERIEKALAVAKEHLADAPPPPLTNLRTLLTEDAIHTTTQSARANPPVVNVSGLPEVTAWLGDAERSPNATTRSKPVTVAVYGARPDATAEAAAAHSKKYGDKARFQSVPQAATTPLPATVQAPVHLSVVGTTGDDVLDAVMLVKALSVAGSGVQVVMGRQISKEDQNKLGLSDEIRRDGYYVYTYDGDNPFVAQQLKVIVRVQGNPGTGERGSGTGGGAGPGAGGGATNISTASAGTHGRTAPTTTIGNIYLDPARLAVPAWKENVDAAKAEWIAALSKDTLQLHTEYERALSPEQRLDAARLRRDLEHSGLVGSTGPYTMDAIPFNMMLFGSDRPSRPIRAAVIGCGYRDLNDASQHAHLPGAQKLAAAVREHSLPDKATYVPFEMAVLAHGAYPAGSPIVYAVDNNPSVAQVLNKAQVVFPEYGMFGRSLSEMDNSGTFQRLYRLIKKALDGLREVADIAVGTLRQEVKNIIRPVTLDLATDLLPDEMTRLNYVAYMNTAKFLNPVLARAAFVKIVFTLGNGGRLVCDYFLTDAELKAFGLGRIENPSSVNGNSYVIYEKEEDTDFVNDLMATIRKAQGPAAGAPASGGQEGLEADGPRNAGAMQHPLVTYATQLRQLGYAVPANIAADRDLTEMAAEALLRLESELCNGADFEWALRNFPRREDLDYLGTTNPALVADWDRCVEYLVTEASRPTLVPVDDGLKIMHAVHGLTPRLGNVYTLEQLNRLDNGYRVVLVNGQYPIILGEERYAAGPIQLIVTPGFYRSTDLTVVKATVSTHIVSNGHFIVCAVGGSVNIVLGSQTTICPDGQFFYWLADRDCRVVIIPQEEAQAVTMELMPAVLPTPPNKFSQETGGEWGGTRYQAQVGDITYNVNILPDDESGNSTYNVYQIWGDDEYDDVDGDVDGDEGNPFICITTNTETGALVTVRGVDGRELDINLLPNQILKGEDPRDFVAIVADAAFEFPLSYDPSTDPLPRLRELVLDESDIMPANDSNTENHPRVIALRSLILKLIQMPSIATRADVAVFAWVMVKGMNAAFVKAATTGFRRISGNLDPRLKRSFVKWFEDNGCEIPNCLIDEVSSWIDQMVVPSKKACEEAPTIENLLALLRHSMAHRQFEAGLVALLTDEDIMRVSIILRNIVSSINENKLEMIIATQERAVRAALDAIENSLRVRLDNLVGLTDNISRLNRNSINTLLKRIKKVKSDNDDGGNDDNGPGNDDGPSGAGGASGPGSDSSTATSEQNSTINDPRSAISDPASTLFHSAYALLNSLAQTVWFCAQRAVVMLGLGGAAMADEEGDDADRPSLIADSLLHEDLDPSATADGDENLPPLEKGGQGGFSYDAGDPSESPLPNSPSPEETPYADFRQTRTFGPAGKLTKILKKKLEELSKNVPPDLQFKSLPNHITIDGENRPVWTFTAGIKQVFSRVCFSRNYDLDPSIYVYSKLASTEARGSIIGYSVTRGDDGWAVYPIVRISKDRSITIDKSSAINLPRNNYSLENEAGLSNLLKAVGALMTKRTDIKSDMARLVASGSPPPRPHEGRRLSVPGYTSQSVTWRHAPAMRYTPVSTSPVFRITIPNTVTKDGPFYADFVGSQFEFVGYCMRRVSPNEWQAHERRIKTGAEDVIADTPTFTVTSERELDLKDPADLKILFDSIAKEMKLRVSKGMMSCVANLLTRPRSLGQLVALALTLGAATLAKAEENVGEGQSFIGHSLSHEDLDPSATADGDENLPPLEKGGQGGFSYDAGDPSESPLPNSPSPEETPYADFCQTRTFGPAGNRLARTDRLKKLKNIVPAYLTHNPKVQQINIDGKPKLCWAFDGNLSVIERVCFPKEFNSDRAIYVYVKCGDTITLYRVFWEKKIKGWKAVTNSNGNKEIRKLPVNNYSTVQLEGLSNLLAAVAELATAGESPAEVAAPKANVQLIHVSDTGPTPGSRKRRLKFDGVHGLTRILPPYLSKEFKFSSIKINGLHINGWLFNSDPNSSCAIEKVFFPTTNQVGGPIYVYVKVGKQVECYIVNKVRSKWIAQQIGKMFSVVQNLPPNQYSLLTSDGLSNLLAAVIDLATPKTSQAEAYDPAGGTRPTATVNTHSHEEMTRGGPSEGPQLVAVGDGPVVAEGGTPGRVFLDKSLDLGTTTLPLLIPDAADAGMSIYRQSETEQLDGAITRGLAELEESHGKPVYIVVAGPSGSGKSILIRDVLTRFSGQNVSSIEHDFAHIDSTPHTGHVYIVDYTTLSPDSLANYRDVKIFEEIFLYPKPLSQAQQREFITPVAHATTDSATIYLPRQVGRPDETDDSSPRPQGWPDVTQENDPIRWNLQLIRSRHPSGAGVISHVPPEEGPAYEVVVTKIRGIAQILGWNDETVGSRIYGLLSMKDSIATSAYTTAQEALNGFYLCLVGNYNGFIGDKISWHDLGTFGSRALETLSDDRNIKRNAVLASTPQIHAYLRGRIEELLADSTLDPIQRQVLEYIRGDVELPK